VEIARGSVDDGGRFDSIEANDVLLYSASGEANVIKRAGARVGGSRDEEVELRDLAAVDGQLLNLTGGDVAADGGRGGIERCGLGLDGDGCQIALDVQDEVLLHLLAYPEDDAGNVYGRKAGL